MTEGTFKIEVPISIRGGRTEGQKIGEVIAQQIQKSLKTLGMVGKTPTAAISGGSGGGLGMIGKGMMKLAGPVALIAEAIDALWVFIKPVMDLFKTVMLLLFMPLIPILKPVMILLGEMAKVLGPIMAEISKAIDGMMKPFSDLIRTTFENLGQPLQDLIISIIQIFMSFVQSLPTILPLITDFMKFLGENLSFLVPIIIDALTWAGEFLVQGWTIIKEALDWASGFLFGNWGTIKDILDWINQWLTPIWDTIKGALGEAYEGIKEKWGIIIDFLDGIADALEIIWAILRQFSPIGGGGGSIFGVLGKIFGFAKGGVVPGPMGKPQFAVVHGGEEVIPRNGRNKSIVLNPTFQFNGSINSDIDIDELMRRASRMAVMDLKQRGAI